MELFQKIFFRTETVLKFFLMANHSEKKLKLGDLKKESGAAGTQTQNRGNVPLLVAQIHALDH